MGPLKRKPADKDSVEVIVWFIGGNGFSYCGVSVLLTLLINVRGYFLFLEH